MFECLENISQEPKGLSVSDMFSNPLAFGKGPIWAPKHRKGPSCHLQYTRVDLTRCWKQQWHVCFPGKCNGSVKCRSGVSSSSLLSVFVTLEWKNTPVCVWAHTPTGWYICFYDSPDSRVQSCAERPKDVQECTCSQTHTITLSLLICSLSQTQAYTWFSRKHIQKPPICHSHTHKHMLARWIAGAIKRAHCLTRPWKWTDGRRRTHKHMHKRRRSVPAQAIILPCLCLEMTGRAVDVNCQRVYWNDHSHLNRGNMHRKFSLVAQNPSVWPTSTSSGLP